ncbi:MAG: trypsin-like peptidase domain-containing protein [Firmicutes bacterium]|nr:trypsin-like peptidase domain-containing protein [Bacillota bacterium]
MDDNNNYLYGSDWAGREEEDAVPAPEPPAAPEPPPVQPPPLYAYNPQGYPPPYPQGAYYPPPPPYRPVPVAPAPAGGKKKRTGLVVFSVFSVLAVAVGVLVGVAIYRNANPAGPTEPGHTQQGGAGADDSRLEIAETPAGTNTPAAGDALTPVQIHEKLKNSNVAVQLYSGRSAERVVGEGSGILLHEDGSKTYTYVLTCAHVISGQERISVQLADGSSFDAAVVGLDSRTDVGLLRIKKTGLKGAEFGDSDKLQVGEPVYAIGNPGGIEFMGSFTNGIVSAIERPIKSRYKMQTIQHTAPINPGNSGGALVNAYGQVVGVNSQKIVDMQYEGMGFAVPSKVVQEVVNNLIAKGYVPNRPKLGIQYIAASETQRGYYVVRINNLPSGSLIIAKIDEDSDITGTDIRANDIITHVNGQPLNKADVLLTAVEKGKVGEELKLTIARVNANYSIETFDVTVKLVEDKGTAAAAEEETRPWYYDDEEDDYGDYGNNPWDW